MTYWRGTVERPDGEGGWIVVGVFGTKDTPGSGTARHLHGDTALDAAQLLLVHVWPINLQEFNARPDDAEKWRDYRAVRQIADYRITVDVSDEHHWSTPYGADRPEPQSFTVAELHLAEIGRRVAELAAAKAELAEITEKVRRARDQVRFGQSLLRGATESAEMAGLPEDVIAKAARPPRRRKKSAS